MRIKLLLLIGLFAFLGCSKNECGITKIVLSNERQAQYKCFDMPNTYPNLDTISIERIECSEVGSQTIFSTWCGFDVTTITIIE